MTLSVQQLTMFFLALVTLFSPLGNIGPFASLVGDLPRPDQKKLANRVFILCLASLLLFVWAGNLVFELLGVDSPSLMVTGGIALIIAGVPMMLGSGKPDKKEPTKETKTWRDRSVVPMTFPMSIDGTDAAYVVSATALAQGTLDLVAISVVIVAYAVVIWLTHWFSPSLAAKLSPQGQMILTRVGGIVLVAIAVQLLADGLKGLLPVLGD